MSDWNNFVLPRGGMCLRNGSPVHLSRRAAHHLKDVLGSEKQAGEAQLEKLWARGMGVYDCGIAQCMISIILSSMEISMHW